MASFSQPLCFMGTNKVSDATIRGELIEERREARDAYVDGTDNPDSHIRNKFHDYSNVRVPGGKAAGPKPIKANYDGDDARIVELKQQGYSDEAVARRLADEGRIRYVARTIGSRWLRIRKALEAKEEEILEDEMSDWHEGEDERLEQAVKEIDKHIEKEIAKLQEKKWLQIATHVAELIQRRKYTAKLCRERYNGLMDGSALMPIELDSDQEGRAELRTSRIASSKRLRGEVAAAQELEEQRKIAAAVAKKEAKAASVAVRLTKAQQKKLDEEKITRMKKASEKQRKTQKMITKQWYAYNKAEAAWLNRKQNAERMLLNKMLGFALNYRPPKAKRVEEEEQLEEEVVYSDDEETENEEVEEVATEDEVVVASSRKHLRSSGSGSDNPTPHKKTANNIPPSTKSRASPGKSEYTSLKSASSKSGSSRHVAIGEAPVTHKTLTSPRAHLTVAQLNVCFSVRNAPKASSQESREQVVARLEKEDELSSADKLKAALGEYLLPAAGSKADLIKRLQVHEGIEKDYYGIS